jgi:delta(3,5)-delta(2,4)-dienoyl-CoA isomerase
VSEVHSNAEDCLNAAVKLAILIASKSPIAVSTSKQSLNFSRDHPVQAGLDHIALLNSVMLQTEDTSKAAIAAMQKQKPTFGKL